MKSITNGAPGVVDYGVDDASSMPYTRTPVPYPQHVPKFFIWAQRGSTDEQLLVGNERLIAYGEDTFTEGSKYFNHATRFANGADALANTAMYVRLIPTDAGPKPTALLSLEVLGVQIDDYERNEDGSIKTNVAGEPVIKGTIANGRKARWLVSHFATEAEAQAFAQRTIETGTLVGPNGEESTVYPIMDIEHSFVGEDGNLAALRIWPTTLKNAGQLPTKMIARDRAFPYNFAVVRKNTETGNSKAVTTVFNEQSVPVVFKEGVKDPTTKQRLFVGDRAVADYQNLTDPRYAKVYGELGRVHVYTENLELVLKDLHQAEMPYLDAGSDMTEDEGDFHLFNPFTGQDTRGIAYHSFVFDNSGDGVRWSQFTNVHLGGGSDGTMDDATYNALLREYMDRYSDENDELNDLAYHIESHIYDTGVEMATKEKLLAFISNRHDTLTVLSPFEYGQPAPGPSEEYSITANLYARAALYPESAYFGTEVYRGLVMGSSGLIRGDVDPKRYPCTYEVMRKTCRMMGAANGNWREEYAFDGGDGAVIDDMYDLSNPWTPSSVRIRNWDVGLNFVERRDRETFSIPALKTVYREDTSVLTGYLTACGFIYLNKVLHKAQKQFSGDQRSTHAQFNQRIKDFVLNEIRGKFGDRFIIRPLPNFTSMDQRRNYSWTLPCEVGAKGMKTVQTSYLVARRYEDMESATA